MRRLSLSFMSYLLHRVCSKALVGSIGFLLAAPAVAEDELTRPTLTLNVALPGIYHSNFGFSRTDRVDGFNSTPSPQLVLAGAFSKNLTYTAIGEIDLDRYSKTGFDSDTALASYGLTYKVAGWELSASYQGQWIYVPYFGTFNARYDDYEFSAIAPAIVLGRWVAWCHPSDIASAILQTR